MPLSLAKLVSFLPFPSTSSLLVAAASAGSALLVEMNPTRPRRASTVSWNKAQEAFFARTTVERKQHSSSESRSTTYTTSTSHELSPLVLSSAPRLPSTLARHARGRRCGFSFDNLPLAPITCPATPSLAAVILPISITTLVLPAVGFAAAPAPAPVVLLAPRPFRPNICNALETLVEEHSIVNLPSEVTVTSDSEDEEQAVDLESRMIDLRTLLRPRPIRSAPLREVDSSKWLHRQALFGAFETRRLEMEQAYGLSQSEPKMQFEGIDWSTTTEEDEDDEYFNTLPVFA